MATNSPKRLQRVKPQKYTTCLLYNTEEALEKLKGLTLALCNPSTEHLKKGEPSEAVAPEDSLVPHVPDLTALTISDVMSCNYCNTVFAHRVDQKRHYRSDWHRYNLKQRLKGREPVDEDQFADISGNISSLSGSDSDNDSESDLDPSNNDTRLPRKLPGARSRIVPSPSSTDSESEYGNQTEDLARRLPKVYFRNHEGQILSMYRCVLYHKKWQPVRSEDLLQKAMEAPANTNWAIFMTGGGHFAAAVFSKEKLLAHKTFHRYVVRAKRGTAQSSRDSQGNAPKSAGASLRRYNEAALHQEIQDLIASWSNYIKDCDKIFLRAPSFNRKIFFGGKNPPLQKGDERIRLIPFQTRRPTFNEVRRVYELLASIECYGDEAGIQDLVPITPPQVFNPDTGQLTTRDESTLSPRQRKVLNRKLNKASPLAAQEGLSSATVEQESSDNRQLVDETESFPALMAVPEHVRQPDNMSSGASTCSDTELVEYMETVNLMELKEYGYTKKPKRKKKTTKQRRNSLKYQTEPESNVLEEERYHLKNSLYTACKVGDMSSLKNLLAVFCTRIINSGNKQTPADVDTVKAGPEAAGEAAHVTLELDEIAADNSCGADTGNDNREGSSSNVSKMSDLRVQLQSSSVEPNAESKAVVKPVDIVDGLTEMNTCVSLSANSGDVTADDAECNSVSNKPDIDENTRSPDTGDLPSMEESGAVNISMSSGVDEGEKKGDENKSTDTDGNFIKPSKLLITDRVLAQPDMSPVVTAAILNETFGDSNTTLLHVAAKEGHKGIVTLLMASGADPSLRDKTGQTPYMVSKDKGTRNEFRKFMATWPDKYNYTVAQIPAPLTEEMESERKKKEAEKKKAQKKAKQERQKVQREEDLKREAEEREKQRFLNLSDREKRAIAAEKRLLSQAVSSGGPTPVLVRCFQCGADMTGKVPFQYFDNKFCAPKCLQIHRKGQPKS